MLITDQIMSGIPNPLIGANVEELGTRFPDMSEAYSERMQQIIKKEAQKLGIPLKEGVYLQLTGHLMKLRQKSVCTAPVG